jgi:hypothetical protein
VTTGFVTLALWADALSEHAFLALMLGMGLFMGTVMGVVQVTVQSAAGSARLGAAAASVQFSRSIGAAMGTAIVATVIFGFLALKRPEAFGLFVEAIEHARRTGTGFPQAAPAAHADIKDVFRAAFLTMAVFTTTGVVLAATNPMRRI